MKQALVLILFFLSAFALQAKENVAAQKAHILDSLAKNDEAAFVEMYPEAMEFFKKNKAWDEYFSTFRTYVVILERCGNNDEILKKAEEIYAFAKEINNTLGMGITSSIIGYGYESLTHFAEAEPYFKQAIGYFYKAKSYEYMFHAYSHYAYVLQNQQKYDAALAALDESKKLLSEYDRQNGKKMVNCHYHIESMYAKIYIKLGKLDKASQFFDQINTYFDQLSISKNEYLLFAIYFYYSVGNNAKIMQLTNTLYDIGKKEGDKMSVAFALLHRSMAAAKLAGRKDIADLILEFNNANDEFSNEQMTQHLNELRIKYDIDKLEMQKERNRQNFLFAIGGCVALLLLSVIFIYLYRAKQRAYRILVKRNLDWAKNTYTLDTDTSPDNRQQTDDAAEIDAESQYLLMQKVYRAFANEQLYRNNNLSLDLLAQKLNTNVRYLSQAVNNIAHVNFKTFINQYRIKEAILLIKDAALNHSFETIAEMCGFSDRSTFYRSFKKETSVTPMQFKQNLDL